MTMVLRYCILFCLISMGFTLHAQWFCNDTVIIMEKKGSWHKSDDVIHDREITAASKKEVFTKIDKLFDYVKEAYPQPIGCEPEWYRTIESRKINSRRMPGGPQPYSFQSLFLEYRCDRSRKDLYLAGGGTWVWIFANQFSWLLGVSDTFRLNGQLFGTRGGYTGQLNGIPVYESFNNGRAILINRPGEMPYTPVTRREYLEMKLRELKERKSNSIESIMKTKIRSDGEHEAEKQKELEKIDRLFAKYPEKKREEAKQRYLKGFKTDVELRNKNLKRSNDFYDKDIKRYQDELNSTSPELLESPACVDKKGKNILADEKEGGSMFVTINENYIKKSLPVTAPQFFVMVWTHWDKHIASRYIKNELETKFPYKKLQTMIDK